MSFTRKRVLVTGGAGLPGSQPCERLLAAGDDVRCVDDYFTGRKDNIAHLMKNPYFPDDPLQRCPDIARIRALLGWEPATPRVAGHKSTQAGAGEAP